MGIRGNNVRVRGGRLTDAVTVREVVETVFGAAQGRVINSVLSELDARGLSQNFFVATLEESDAEEIVGVVGLSRAWVDARESLVEVLLLSPLAVLEEHRDQGVGEALLKASVAYGDEVGAPMLVVEGNPTYYAAKGWVEAAEHELGRPSARIPSAAFRVRMLRAYETWMTGQVIYPDPWWCHDVVGLRDPVLAEVEASLGS